MPDSGKCLRAPVIITGNGLAAGCKVFDRKIYGYFLQCTISSHINIKAQGLIVSIVSLTSLVRGQHVKCFTILITKYNDIFG